MNPRKENEFKLLGLTVIFYPAIMLIQALNVYRESSITPLKEENPNVYLILSIGFLLLLCVAIFGFVKRKKSILFIVLGLTGILTLMEIFYLR